MTLREWLPIRNRNRNLSLFSISAAFFLFKNELALREARSHGMPLVGDMERGFVSRFLTALSNDQLPNYSRFGASDRWGWMHRGAA
jgi:hypothetical protein